MAKDWKCAHCGTANAATTLTCIGCRRIQGSVVVPTQPMAPPSGRDQPPPLPLPVVPDSLPTFSGPAPAGGTGWQQPAEGTSLRRFGFGILLVVLLLVVGTLGALVVANPLAPIAGPTATSNAAGPADGSEVLVTELEVGDCFDVKDDDAEFVGDVLAKACTRNHQFELFHILEFPEGTYPGLAWIESSAQARCQPALENYTGEAYDTSVIDFSWFYPDEDAWIQDDRTVQCFAYFTGKTLSIGSLRVEPGAEASARPTASRASAPRDDAGSGTVNVSDLRQGDCWTTESWEPDELGNVNRMSCGFRHQFEVVWAGTYAGNTYPTTEGAFLTYIDALCSPAFEDYVGGPWLDSPYEVWWTYPSADRWLDGDRTVVCSAFDVDGPIAYSVKDEMR